MGVKRCPSFGFGKQMCQTIAITPQLFFIFLLVDAESMQCPLQDSFAGSGLSPHFQHCSYLLYRAVL